ncbi:MAG: SAM-dependent methyltransferase [Muribaculaceae bacterium]|nr:SAM-dependent methyltransferase [Muribaculaceae bacterium]
MAQCAPSDVLPQKNIELISAVKFFVVEELRTARRFLKACNKAIDIDSLNFSVLNEHTQPGEVAAMLQPALEGNDIGIISEAGCPAVADPGADLVAVAQRKGIEVVPLVGPSSILLSLMGSGFNGQSFAFLGYLPVDAAKRNATLRQMERDIRRNQTQIFIETPYRNNRLVAELADSLPAEMMLCVAADITAPTQSIVTRPIKDWKKASYDYNKRPAIFLLYHA